MATFRITGLSVLSEEPIVGYSMAWVEDGVFVPFFRRDWCVWHRGEGRAACRLDDSDEFLGALLAPGHSSPHPYCPCGVMVSSTPPAESASRWGNAPVALAVVAVWGRVAADRTGIRGDHGRLLAVALSPAQPAGQRRAVSRAAHRSGVALRTAEELDALVTAEAFLPSSADLIAHDAVTDVPTDVDYDPEGEPARHRFVFGATDGKIRHSATVSGDDIRSALRRWPCAIGEIRCAPDGRAVAAFAYVDSRHRARAEAHLRRWAELDCWRLTIDPGTSPLSTQTFRLHDLGTATPHYLGARFHGRAGGGSEPRQYRAADP